MIQAATQRSDSRDDSSSDSRDDSSSDSVAGNLYESVMRRLRVGLSRLRLGPIPRVTCPETVPPVIETVTFGDTTISQASLKIVQ